MTIDPAYILEDITTFDEKRLPPKGSEVETAIEKMDFWTRAMI